MGTNVHEMSLAQGILDIVEDTARREQARRVKVVWLEIGQLSAVESSAMSFCFDVVVRGTVAEGAQLNIVPVEGRAWCMQCCASVALAARADPCPACGSHQLQVTDGTQMRVRELEIDG
jgi:hydrogenase nickel incorporation protein HypA/HybF